MFRHVSDRTARVLAVLFLSTTLALAAALTATWWYTFRLVRSFEPQAPETLPTDMPSAQVSPLQVRYQLDLPGRGEIFPALVASNASDYWPVAILTITNLSSRPVVQTVTAEIPDWSRRLSHTVLVGPRQTLPVRITPDLLPQAYQNTELRKAMLYVGCSDPGQYTRFSQARPLFLHSVSDLYWGSKFSNAQYLARWVTPHDEKVMQLVSAARRYAPRGRLAGYRLTATTQLQLRSQVETQARAIFKAMQHSGISYVDSLFTFGNFTASAQRIRLPSETLTQSSANCVDVSVAFASAVENLGMNPVIVIVPGHAFTGVRLGRDSEKIVYLDLTVLPDGSFERAVARARYWLKKTPPDQLLMIDVAAARTLGIYPIPDEILQPAAQQGNQPADGETAFRLRENGARPVSAR
jgi:hypothetical protein